MRKLSFLFIIVFALAVNITAQTPSGNRLTAGTRAAGDAEYEKALENYRKAILLYRN